MGSAMGAELPIHWLNESPLIDEIHATGTESVMHKRRNDMPASQEHADQLRDALHAMNNALNSISMQAELGRLYVERNDVMRIDEALQTIMAQSRCLRGLLQQAHTLFIAPHEMKAGDS